MATPKGSEDQPYALNAVPPAVPGVAVGCAFMLLTAVLVVSAGWLVADPYARDEIAIAGVFEDGKCYYDISGPGAGPLDGRQFRDSVSISGTAVDNAGTTVLVCRQLGVGIPDAMLSDTGTHRLDAAEQRDLPYWHRLTVSMIPLVSDGWPSLGCPFIEAHGGEIRFSTFRGKATVVHLRTVGRRHRCGFG
jgi:hypothetical protein